MLFPSSLLNVKKRLPKTGSSKRLETTEPRMASLCRTRSGNEAQEKIGAGFAFGSRACSHINMNQS